MARIYAASSWRNERHPLTVEVLRAAGHEVYDFRNPDEGQGFSWDEIDSDWQRSSARDPEYIRWILAQPRAAEGFGLDMAKLNWCDVCVLTLPCGRSAHLELGYAVGRGKRTAVLLDDISEPELMYRMVEKLCVDEQDLLSWLTERG